MVSYRVYRIDEKGKIRAGEWFDASDDEAAKARAQALCEPGTPGMEVWQGGRLVGKVACESTRGARRSS